MREYVQVRKVRDDLTGQVFGRLTVIRLLGSYKNQHYWLCSCSCGGESEVPTRSLRSGNARSCGCVAREKAAKRRSTHGRSGTPIYGMWRRMIQRCEDVNCGDYKYYGARGITVCTAWHDFPTFLMDVGERPDGMTLDRIDNDSGYKPGNVRWVTRQEQMANTRRCRYVEYNGETKTVSDWARERGIKPRTLHARLHTLGYTVEEALSKDVYPGRMLNGKTWRENKGDAAC